MIIQELVHRIELGTSRSEVHRLIGEPQSSSEDGDYYPGPTLYLCIGGLSHSHEVHYSHGTKLVYEDDTLKRKMGVQAKAFEGHVKDFDALHNNEDTKTQK